MKLFLGVLFLIMAASAAFFFGPRTDRAEIDAEFEVEEEEVVSVKKVYRPPSPKGETMRVRPPVPVPSGLKNAKKKVVKKKASEEKVVSRKVEIDPKAGFRRLKRSCFMYSEPSKKSAKLRSMAARKKLWSELHNEGWVKVFRKEGPAYIPKNCF